jgi:hypothetical protein
VVFAGAAGILPGTGPVLLEEREFLLLISLYFLLFQKNIPLTWFESTEFSANHLREIP